MDSNKGKIKNEKIFPFHENISKKKTIVESNEY